MTWRHRLTLIGCTLLVLVSLAVACAPKAPPSAGPSASSPAPAPLPAPAVPRAAPTPGPQEQALARLVEAAKKEGKLTAYSFSFTGDIGLALARAFQERYGITLNIITGRGGEMQERIKTETRSGQIVADFMETSPTNNMNLKVGGLTVSSRDLPVFQDKDVWGVDPLINDPEGHLLGHRAMLFPAWYNTRQLKPEDLPKAYKDLTQPKWRSKFAVPDSNVSSGSYDLFMTLQNRGYLDLDTVRSIGRNEPHFVAGTRQVADAVARGEAAVGTISSDVDAAPFLREGAPLRPMDMQEGIIALSSTMARVKGGPNPNATLLFMNWMFTKEGQTVYTQVAGLFSVRKDVPDARPEAGKIRPARIVTLTNEDAVRNAQLLRDKYLTDLWKK